MKRLIQIAFVLSLLLVGSCQHFFPHLTAYTEYLTIERLASTIVETPDPLKYYPELGQRLVINWYLPADYLKEEDLHLEVVVRFRNREQDSFSIPICRANGGYYYEVLNDDFSENGGILTYKMDLIGSGEVLEVWRHQMWTELICLDKVDKLD